ncbi:unnamed protein product [Euphydryas editha]|uniref:DDE-1 domain-containing protein n=1 Tax=Euphydryas editha TaxID=104508 RepID=A0AAU9TR94_EUPED|nr:unnamed protein product [Euphydryas editha]
MPRVYKTKQGSKKREIINKDKLKAAVYDVIYRDKSLRGVAKTYNMSVMTLKRYAQVFTESEELELSNYLETASKLYHGLTPKATRLLAFQFALKNNKKMPENWQKNEIASYDWIHGFIRRHSNLSLRVPEATSLSRATSFNKHNVSKFFQNLQSMYTRFQFEPQDVWNLDETGITTVHKPKKIIACKGLKQVSKVTSAERGELVTLCCAISAAGICTPPFLIFPRKIFQNRMIDNGPPGTAGVTYPSGWMTVTNFVLFLKHFKKYVRCSKDNPCLIIMDNHESHISIDSVYFARENGIHLLTIPPHTSQKLQPLDRILFGALKSYYNTACDDWMMAHPGRPLTIYDICGCLGKAYPSAMTPRNIVKSFEITGIYPFNSEIFTEDDFLSSYVTDRPEDSVAGLENVQTNAQDNNVTNDAIDVPDDDTTDAEDILQDVSRERTPSPQILKSLDIDSTSAVLTLPLSQQCLTVLKDTLMPDSFSGDSSACAVQENLHPSQQSTSDASLNSINISPSILINTTIGTSTVEQFSSIVTTNTKFSHKLMEAKNKTLTDFQEPSTSKYISFDIIKPHPKAGPRKCNRKGKKKGATKIITDTPEKNEIEEEARKKEEKKRINAAKVVKRNLKNTKKQQNVKKAKTVKRQKRNAEHSVSPEEEVTLPPSPESNYFIEENSNSEEEDDNNHDEDNVHEGIGLW